MPRKKTELLRYLASTPCALPDRYLLTAPQATAGGNLTFLRDNILYHKHELLREMDMPDVFKLMDQIATRVPAGSRREYLLAADASTCWQQWIDLHTLDLG